MRAEDTAEQDESAERERGRGRALPAALTALTELALDLRWAGTEDVATLFRALDEETWLATHNPCAVLQTAGAERLLELANTPSFVLSLRTLDARRRDRGRRSQEPSDRTLREHLIAYFSMEFGLAPGLPIYAGGLGVLAGDLLKAASDRGLPMVAVGILFQQGHFAQVLRNTRQEECYPLNEPSQMPVRALRAPDGSLVRVPLQIAGRRVWLRAWLAQVGGLELYLLDSNDPANRATDRCITQQLYIGGPETRLLQEIVLGIGGYRLLDMLGLCPSILHINEGHAAFAALERTRIFARNEACTFQEALWATRAGNVFTTHTALAAGFDRFAPELITGALLGPPGALSDLELSAATLLSLGRDQQDDGYFNMACLALRCSGFANAVSRSHCLESRKLFAGLVAQHGVEAHGSRRAQHGEEPAISYVTNGVDVRSWIGSPSDRLWCDNQGEERWLKPLAAAQMSDERLWEMRCTQRAQLVAYALRRSQSGANSEAVRVPRLEPDILTLGFARRCPVSMNGTRAIFRGAGSHACAAACRR